MGLFSKKEPCAICGGKVKGLFPWSVDGQYVCNDCYGNVDVSASVRNKMTMDEFRGYLAFREENNRLKKEFKVMQTVDFGVLDTKVVFDFGNRLMCLDKNLDTTVFRGNEIHSFLIKEDSTPLLEGSAAGLCRYDSNVPRFVMNMAPQIQRFRMQVQAEMARKQNGQNRPEPRFDVPEPFQRFNIEIYFRHPYWDVFKADIDGPKFNDTRPDVKEYLNSYHLKVDIVEELAHALMRVAFPNASEQASGASAAAAPVDAVTEIQRYKKLLDQGVISEEEFTAKKRQLLGI